MFLPPTRDCVLPAQRSRKNIGTQSYNTQENEREIILQDRQDKCDFVIITFNSRSLPPHFLEAVLLASVITSALAPVMYPDHKRNGEQENSSRNDGSEQQVHKAMHTSCGTIRFC